MEPAGERRWELWPQACYSPPHWSSLQFPVNTTGLRCRSAKIMDTWKVLHRWAVMVGEVGGGGDDCGVGSGWYGLAKDCVLMGVDGTTPPPNKAHARPSLILVF